MHVLVLRLLRLLLLVALFIPMLCDVLPPFALLIFRLPNSLPDILSRIAPIMLTHRSCHDCGLPVRLSVTIYPPRCPAYRLAHLPALLGTRPCLACPTQLPTRSSTRLCKRCQLTHSSFLGCGNLFLACAGLSRCSVAVIKHKIGNIFPPSGHLRSCWKST